jgi:hypothetical protein
MNYISKFIYGEKLDSNEVLNHKRVAAAARRKPANQFTAAKQSWIFRQTMGARRGYGYRSTGRNINGPNINKLQINCSIDQRKPVDV